MECVTGVVLNRTKPTEKKYSRYKASDPDETLETDDRDHIEVDTKTLAFRPSLNF